MGIAEEATEVEEATEGTLEVAKTEVDTEEEMMEDLEEDSEAAEWVEVLKYHKLITNRNGVKIHLMMAMKKKDQSQFGEHHHNLNKSSHLILAMGGQTSQVPKRSNHHRGKEVVLCGDQQAVWLPNKRKSKALTVQLHL
jgi:hypothetical protein